MSLAVNFSPKFYVPRKSGYVPQSINTSEIQNFHISHELPELRHENENSLPCYRLSEQPILVIIDKRPTYLMAIHLKYKIDGIPCPQVASTGVVHRRTCPCTNGGIAQIGSQHQTSNCKKTR